VSAINDRQRLVVARSRDAEKRVGKPVVEWFAAATRKANSGIVDGPLVDGRRGQIAFQQLKEVPWVVALAIPVAELPSTTPLVLFLVVGAVMVCAAVGLALYTGRRITGPIARLADAGGALVRGEAVGIGPPADIREVQELQQALGEASTAVQGYYQERERAAVAVETAKVATAAEQALRASEERLDLFIQNAPAAIAMFDREMRYLAVSRRWLTDYGLGDRDILGQSHYTVFPDIPDAWKSVHQRALAGEVVQAAEDCFERLDGAVQWLRWEVRPWHAGDGTVGGIILFTEDITDRKRAEEEIRSLAKFPSENPFPILRTAIDGTILYANLASLPLLGTLKTGKDRLLPKSWRESVQQVYAAGMPRELEIASGERVFSIVLVPILDAGYVNLYGRDITDRKRAEAALRKAHDELELRVQERTVELSTAIQTLEKQSEQLRTLASELTQAEQRERRRLATVLHDEHQQLLVGAKLRLGPLERVEDPRLREGIREVSVLLDEAIENARSLTRELSPPILQAGGLIPALDWLARWMGEKHHLQVDVQTDETAVPATEDMTILLFQSVRELLFNVVKHAKVPTARVETTRREEEVRIVVSDGGVGFDPTSLRIEDGRASGFGLFSIRQRLELLGGRLDIASTPGQGSRITLSAPLRQAGAPTLQAPEKTERPEAGAMAAGPPPVPGRTGKIRVLVVDDHKVVRQGLARLLAAEADIQIVGEAADGKAAVELARRLSPDVVTMDISMPVMNGIEATRAILAECPAVRVIGLSMFEEVEQAQAMRDAGAVAYLSKSGAADALVAAVRACVGISA
jgi:PAS domain S-box-containing protein